MKISFSNPVIPILIMIGIGSVLLALLIQLPILAMIGIFFAELRSTIPGAWTGAGIVGALIALVIIVYCIFKSK
jgi:hypothetical protein